MLLESVGRKATPLHSAARETKPLVRVAVRAHAMAYVLERTLSDSAMAYQPTTGQCRCLKGQLELLRTSCSRRFPKKDICRLGVIRLTFKDFSTVLAIASGTLRRIWPSNT
jgi:hypothetical protein